MSSAEVYPGPMPECINPYNVFLNVKRQRVVGLPEHIHGLYKLSKSEVTEDVHRISKG